MNGDPLDELDEQADEITRLRLTDNEREAIIDAIILHDMSGCEKDSKIANTLRCFLLRIGSNAATSNEVDDE